jgi:hypothetical protein
MKPGKKVAMLFVLCVIIKEMRALWWSAAVPMVVRF